MFRNPFLSVFIRLIRLIRVQYSDGSINRRIQAA